MLNFDFKMQQNFVCLAVADQNSTPEPEIPTNAQMETLPPTQLVQITTSGATISEQQLVAATSSDETTTSSSSISVTTAAETTVITTTTAIIVIITPVHFNCCEHTILCSYKKI